MTESDLLDDLNEMQREAVTHIDGPLLVLAGPGSGKTRVITRRVAYLLLHGIHPANILAITFTNKAAGEMRNRINALTSTRGLWISTFHAMGARLLREYADRIHLDPNFTIYDQTDRLRVIKTALEDAQIDPQRVSADSIMYAISKAKNELIGPNVYESRAHDYFQKIVAKVYPLYQQRLKDQNAMDFDDLLFWPAILLQQNAELRKELDARFRYVLIDEYQDTNKAQYVIVRELCRDYPNLCVVGDPDQSIYKFRGSDIRNILNFERDFPKARVLTLNVNYRSTRSILGAASGLISHNIQRKSRDLLTENDPGRKVQVLSFGTGNDEVDGIARMIRETVKAGKRSFRDFAILVRINALTRSLEQSLVNHRVLFQIVKGLAFFERKENRDILAYLRLLLNPCDDVSFERVVNEPSRGIGLSTLTHLRLYANSHNLSLLSACGQATSIPGIRNRYAQALRDFHSLMMDLQALANAPPDEVLRQVLDRTGYRTMLKESQSEEDQARLANVEELITHAKQAVEGDSALTLSDYLANITLSSDIDGYNETQDRVSIMTMHAAKGLEFPVVIVAAVEEGILPHQRALDTHKQEEIEEERRLLFVAMTRAKEELYLSLARNARDFRGQTNNNPVPSSFLAELPGEQIEWIDHSGQGVPQIADRYRQGGPAAAVGWKDAGVEVPLPVPSKVRSDEPFGVGAVVQHQEYGIGKVIELTGLGTTRTVKVRFPKRGVFSFRVAQAKLTVISRQ